MKSDSNSTGNGGLLERSLLAVGLPLWTFAQFAQFLGCLFLIELALALLGKPVGVFSANPWFPIAGATFYATCMVVVALVRVRKLRKS